MGKKYPYSFTLDEFDDFVNENIPIGDFDKHVLFFSLDDEPSVNTIVLDDRSKLFQAAKMYVNENPNWQLYTEVDLDTGDVGYSAGPRMVNNLDNYVAIKINGYGPPDNS